MLTKYFYRLFILAAMLALLLVACSPATPNADATAIADAYIRTQAAASVRMTLTAAAVPLDSNITPSLSFATETPTGEPSETPTQTLVPFTDTPQPTSTQTPEPQANCTDKAKFVKETVPDKTQFQPGQALTKTWTIQNVGTCTWTTAYSFVFVEGEQMGAPQSTSLPQAIPPQGEITVSVNLTAPGLPGEYQGDFWFKNASGTGFGVGRNADLAVWVLIRVVETDTTLDLGNPTWTDKFDVQSNLWPLFKDAFTNFEIKNGNLVVSALAQSGDLWRVVTYPAVSDQFIQAIIKTPESCSGKNSYGFAIRSYAQGDSNYDSGYIIAFSCDGMFRVYSLNNGTFMNIKDWTNSDSLLKGGSQTNRVGVMAKGNQISVYINGVKAASFTDNSHTSGQFGIVIRAGDSAPFTVNVEEFSYWELK